MVSGTATISAHSSMLEHSIPMQTLTCTPAEPNVIKNKKHAYEQRVKEVEHSSFTPLVLSATGSLASEATTSYKQLAACLAEKWYQPYSSTMAWLCCRITFPLLRSGIQCIRGVRPSIDHAFKSPPSIDLVTFELKMVKISLYSFLCVPRCAHFCCCCLFCFVCFFVA